MVVEGKKKGDSGIWLYMSTNTFFRFDERGVADETGSLEIGNVTIGAFGGYTGVANALVLDPLELLLLPTLSDLEVCGREKSVVFETLSEGDPEQQTRCVNINNQKRHK